MNVLTHQPLWQRFYFPLLLFLLRASEFPCSVTSAAQFGLRQGDGALRSDGQVVQDVFLRISLEYSQIYTLMLRAEKVDWIVCTKTPSGQTLPRSFELYFSPLAIAEEV